MQTRITVCAGSPPGTVLVTPAPGAASATQEPRLLKPASVRAGALAPTDSSP